MTTHRNRPRSLAFGCLVSPLLWPLLALADPVELPLHLDPVRLEPYDGYLHGAAAASVEGGLYLVYAGTEFGGAPVGLPLLPDGTAASPNPIRFVDYVWQGAGTMAVGAAGGDALVSWSQQVDAVEHVFAVLQPHATWTHLVRPRIDVGVGRVPAVAGAGAGSFGLLAFATTTGLVDVRVDPVAWPSLPPPVPLAPGPMSDFALTSIAFAPEAARAMIVWSIPGFIHARIVDASGNPVTDRLGLVAVPATGVSVSWNGSHFVVVWSTSSSIDLKRIDADGVPIDQQPIHVASSQGHAAASASIPGQTLVSWIGDDDAPSYEVRAARVNDAGQVLDPGGFVLYLGERDNLASEPNQVTGVTANGPGYYVTWIENHPLCGGVIVDLQDVLGAVVSSGDPPAVGPARIVSGSAAQDGVAVAVVGDRFWTAWLGRTRSDPEMLAARRSPAGALLDPQGLVLGHEPFCGPERLYNTFYPPAVAGNPGAVLTAWRHVDHNDSWWDLCTVRYCVHDADGLVAGCSGFTYQNVGNLGPNPPVAASGGTGFLVAFTAPAPGGLIVMRWAGIENAGGQAAGGLADLGSSEVLEDAAAAAGAGYLVSWTEDGDGQDAYVGRFDAGFTFLDPSGILLAGGPGQQNPARLASDGRGYLAVWDDAGPLRAARIDTQGVILDPGGVLVVTRSGATPFDLDWDGEHYVIAWIEADGSEQVARLKRLAPDLTSPDPEPIELARRPDLVPTCRVASMRDGLSLIALTTRRPNPGGGTMSSSGHGILYRNPAAAAIAPWPAPASSMSVVAHPNPFRSTTEIVIGDRAGRPGVVRILDAAGRLVHEFRAPHGLAPAIHWDGNGRRGRPLAAGMYFYEVAAEDRAIARGKIVKLR